MCTSKIIHVCIFSSTQQINVVNIIFKYTFLYQGKCDTCRQYHAVSLWSRGHVAQIAGVDTRHVSRVTKDGCEEAG